MKDLQTVADVINRQLQKGVFLSVGGATPNTMAVAWGGYTFFWNKPMFIAPIRPQRFTYPILQQQRAFTLSIPGPEMMDKMRKAGALSGRSGNKFEAIGLETAPGKEVDAPVILGCPWQVECRVLATTDLTQEHTDPEIAAKIYAGNDYHTLFISEIVACYAG